MEANKEKTINRRDLFTGAGLVTAGLLTQALQNAHAGGHTANRELLTEEQQLALEKTNDELVTNFINDYAKRDAELLASYMHDDIIYQVTEGMPEVVGKEAYIKRNSDMFAGLEKIDWITLRQFTIGQVVINDRMDEFYPYPGSRVPRMRFRVTGYFLIEDGKIRVWRDFGYPGAKQLVEPAPKA